VVFHPRPDLWSLDPNVLHLNHGSYGAVPRRTQEVAAKLRAEMEANPMAWFRRLPDRLAASRRELAAYLGADPDGFALVPNASAGVTVALSTVPIASGERIVITDHAYGAIRYAAERASRLRGAELITARIPLEADDDELVAVVADALDERTAAVVVDQISSATARVFPVDRLVRLCREAGIPVIVDGAHAPGLLDHPVADDADFWTGNFHKWPCAPRGTAGLVVTERWRDRTRPLITSWGEYDDMPARFDQQGTNDYVPWLAAPTSLEVLERDLDWPRRRSWLSAMLTDACGTVANALGTTLPDVTSPAPTMRLVELPACLSATNVTERIALRNRAAEQIGAELAVTSFGDRSFLRLSAHAYNSPRDYELLADHLRTLMRER
jgi:isopenicillin-N epimerase